MRILVILAFLGVLASLASAFIYFMRDKGGTSRTANALTVRIGLSIVLFLFVVLSYRMGWIDSTGVIFRRL